MVSLLPNFLVFDVLVYSQIIVLSYDLCQLLLHFVKFLHELLVTLLQLVPILLRIYSFELLAYLIVIRTDRLKSLVLPLESFINYHELSLPNQLSRLIVLIFTLSIVGLSLIHPSLLRIDLMMVWRN